MAKAERPERAPNTDLSGIGEFLSLAAPYAPFVAMGANLLGNLFAVGSESRRLKKLRAEREKALLPMKQRLEAADFGLSQSEGGEFNQAVDNTLTDLSQRNMLESSVAPLELAQATAPIQARAAGNRQNLQMGLAAGQTAIANDTSAPGVGAAFGGSLGETGGFLALQAGRAAGRSGQDNQVADLLQQLREQDEDLDRRLRQRTAVD